MKKILVEPRTWLFIERVASLAVGYIVGAASQRQSWAWYATVAILSVISFRYYVWPERA